MMEKSTDSGGNGSGGFRDSLPEAVAPPHLAVVHGEQQGQGHDQGQDEHHSHHNNPRHRLHARGSPQNQRHSSDSPSQQQQPSSTKAATHSSSSLAQPQAPSAGLISAASAILGRAPTPQIADPGLIRSLASGEPSPASSGAESPTPTSRRHHLKSLRPIVHAIMAFEKSRKFSTGTSAHRKRQMSTIVEKEGHFGPSLTVCFLSFVIHFPCQFLSGPEPPDVGFPASRCWASRHPKPDPSLISRRPGCCPPNPLFCSDALTRPS